MVEKKIHELELMATKIRRHALKAIQDADSGHLGGSFSIAEILSVLYFDKMNVDPKAPRDPKRDRLVLSKGHCTPALYSTLALKGYFPAEDLKTFRGIDSYLSGHAEMKHVPGVDMSTGSLGQGFSAAVGIALAGKMDKLDYNVYAILGDGEIQEGQIWEAAMSAGFFHLNKLIVFVDNNNLQIDGTIEEVMSPYPIDKKFESFNFNVICIDGHDVAAITAAIDQAKTSTDKPTAIICKTVKAKGISFMENDVQWHGNTPNEEEFAKGFAELDARIAQLEEEVK